MKWIGQHIWDQISRFRSDVYLEDISTGTIASGGNLGLDSNNKIVKATEASGDITAVTITTDSGGGSAASDTGGSADFSILGSSGVGVTNSGTTITAVSVPGEIDHDSLLNFVAAEHYAWALDISGTATIHTNNITDLHGAGVDGSSTSLLTDNGSGAISSEAYLTFRNSGNASTLNLLSNEDTGDRFTIGTTTHGATTLTTNDDDATAAHFEIAADGNITLDAAGDIALEAAGDIALEAAGNDLTLDADNFVFTSATTYTPSIYLINQTDDISGPTIYLQNQRGGEDNDYLGMIVFRGYNDAGTPELLNYATITSQIHDATDGEESGMLSLRVANHDGGLGSGLILTGGSVDGEVDVTVGLGAASVVTVPGHIDLAGSIDVDGTLEADAITVGGTALTSVCSPVAGHASIATVGTIGTGVWQGTAIASAYLDADTAHYSATKQFTYHMFKDDIDQTKHYIGLQEADSEQETVNKNLPFAAGVAGKLLKVFLRATGDLSAKTLTWRLETLSTSSATGSTPTVVGTQSGAGCTASSMATYDFTTGLDSGDNIIDAGDQVHLSIESSANTANVIYYVTCLWEWDLG